MPKFDSLGVSIYYEETGKGFPLVFSHEFAGDYRSWEAQVRFFSRRYRVITYNARGYPPSDVPADQAAYSPENSVADLYRLLQHLNIERAYVVGLSMGGAVALSFAIAHPEMTAAVVPAGTGAGTTGRDAWRASMEANIRMLEEQGIVAAGEVYGKSPNRLQYLHKDPRGWQEFYQQFITHSAQGSARTIRGVMLQRPTIFQLEEKLKTLQVPTLVMVGDEDEGCIEPSLFMKKHIPGAGLATFPRSGHLLNLEEPDLFNRLLLDFLTTVEAGRWY